jgi:hypothetical protein
MEDQILSEKENFENFIKPNLEKKGEQINQQALMRSIMGTGRTKIWRPDNIKFIDQLIQKINKDNNTKN